MFLNKKNWLSRKYPKHMKKKTNFTFLHLFLFVALTLTGCVDETDYSTPQEQVIPESLQGVTVPSGFDWSTTTLMNIVSDVDDTYNGTYNYKVEIFDSNPIITTNPGILAVGLAKKGQPFTAKVMAPKTLSSIYVQQTSPTGEKVVKIISTSQSNVTVSFGSTATTKSASSTLRATAATSYTVPTRTYVTPTSNIQTIEGSADFLLRGNNVSYVIPKGKTFTGKIVNDWWQATSIYVEGTWINTGDFESHNATVIIQDGGKYVAPDASSNIILNENTKFVVAANAVFNSENRSVSFKLDNANAQIINNSSTFNINDFGAIKQLYNYGTITVNGSITIKGNDAIFVNEGRLTLNNELSLSSASKFINTGEMTIVQSLTANADNITIENSGKLTVKKISINGNIQINNTCNLTAEETEFKNNVKLSVATGGIYKSKLAIFGANTKVSLAEHAILDITERLDFTNTGSSINGPQSGEKALARLAEFTVNSGTTARPSFSGYLQIESSVYPPQQRGTETTYDYPSDPKYVDFVRKGESTVAIESSDCNAGGNTLKQSDPVVIKYPLTVNLSNTYSYAFEDNYPQIEDYDMNDLVMDITVSYTLTASNKVSDLTIKSKLRALGASKMLALAIQLDGILTTNVSKITQTGTLLTGKVFSLKNGLETGQTYAVIPLSDDVHTSMGVQAQSFVNTEPSKAFVENKVITSSVEFKTPVDITDKNIIEMLNVFIVNGGYTQYNRNEVHIINYKSTDRSRDLSASKNYSSSNFVYAIRIPKSFAYPSEWVSIIDAYPSFKAWVEAGGENNTDWYDHPTSGKVYTKDSSGTN